MPVLCNSNKITTLPYLAPMPHLTKAALLLILAGALGAWAFKGRTSLQPAAGYSKEDFERVCNSLAVTELKLQAGAVYMRDKQRNRYLTVAAVQTMDGRTTMFQPVKGDSLFVVEEPLGYRGAVLFRAADLKHYQKGKGVQEVIYKAGDSHYVAATGKAMPDRYFFYEAAILAQQHALMPYQNPTPAVPPGTLHMRWFNIELAATVDSIKAWSQKVCGHPDALRHIIHSHATGVAALNCAAQ